MDYYALLNNDGKAVGLFCRNAETTEETVWRDGAWHDDGGLLAEALVDGWPNMVSITEANSISLQSAM